MNTLTGIEAERVRQILNHAIERLRILTYVPTSWDGDEDVIADISSPAALASLERQWLAEENLAEIGEMVGSSEAGGKEISILKQAHRATRATCRNLMADRDSLQALMNRQQTQSEEYSKFVKYLTLLEDDVYKKLNTTVEEEASLRNSLHEMTERERHLEESKDTLQAKLDEVKEEKERVIFSLDQTMRKLTLEVQEITQHNAVELESVQKEMSDAISKATADHELRMRQLQDQVDAMERQSAEVIEKNREEEQRLRKEKIRAESTLNSKIVQYDEYMIARELELLELKRQFEIESRDYAVLKEYFDKVDADITRSAEEEYIIAAIKTRERFGYRVLDDAATMIQKIVRGRQVKAVYAKMKAKAKKGKKGKKGKK